MVKEERSYAMSLQRQMRLHAMAVKARKCSVLAFAQRPP